MTTLTKKSKTSQIKYIRIPVDSKTKTFLDKIKLENPLFSDVDSFKFVLGKYFTSSNQPNNVFDKIRAQLANEPELTEDQIFGILKQNKTKE